VVAWVRPVAGDIAGWEPIAEKGNDGPPTPGVAAVCLEQDRICLPIKQTPSGCEAPAAIHTKCSFCRKMLVCIYFIEQSYK